MSARGFLTVVVSGVALAAVGVGCAAVQAPGAGLTMRDEATGAPAGEKFRAASLEGYQLAYYLFDLRSGGASAAAAGSPSHHLMLYVTAPDGKPIADAKVGYTVTGPEGSPSRVAAYTPKGPWVVRDPRAAETAARGTVMEGGYGADVDLGSRADYRIAAEVALPGRVLRDEFAYSVR